MVTGGEKVGMAGEKEKKEAEPHPVCGTSTLGSAGNSVFGIPINTPRKRERENENDDDEEKDPRPKANYPIRRGGEGVGFYEFSK